MRDRRPRVGELGRWTEMTSLGLLLPSSIIVGLVFGWLLDKVFGTRPWFLLIFFVLGAVSGVYSLFRALARYNKEDREN